MVRALQGNRGALDAARDEDLALVKDGAPLRRPAPEGGVGDEDFDGDANMEGDAGGNTDDGTYPGALRSGIGVSPAFSMSRARPLSKRWFDPFRCRAGSTVVSRVLARRGYWVPVEPGSQVPCRLPGMA